MPHRDGHEGHGFEKYHDDLLGFAHRYLAGGLDSLVDASDMVQTTLLTAVAKQLQFRGDSEAEEWAWLCRILINGIHSELRKIKRWNGGRDQSLDDLIDASSVRLIAALAAEESTPSQKCSKAEERALLLEKLNELPENQRTIVKLHYLEERPVPESAAMMGLTTSAASSLLYRAMRAFRAKMGQGNADSNREPGRD